MFRHIHRSVPGALMLLFALTSAAHHSSAPFEDERTIRLEGTVTRVKWANPHVYIDVRVTDQDGEQIDWLIEGLPPAGLRSAGWDRDSLVPGEQVVFSGYPARDPGKKAMLGASIIKSNGSVLPMPNAKNRADMVRPPLEEPFVAEDMSGRWETRWNPPVASRFVQPADRWPVTDKGQAAMDSYDASMDPAARCVPEPLPYAMIWPSGKSIEISDDQIHIRDELDIERTVHLNTDGHDGAEYSNEGHSIGRWEDDVLVVDTTHFAEHRRGIAFSGLASGQQKHLVERFELSDDRTQIHYSFWLEDPEYLAEPVTGELTLVYRPDFPFLHEPCDVESAARHLTH